ncbi:MAG: hypothetical protein CM1200mP25_4460 [Acidobacteriota bacterium]|nr:MAG: hypothetical protein CM1200mP25_4460 [Acidobacteriota bacterium]
MALKMRGESVEELVGMARVMRSHSLKLSRPIADCFDTCGTGGDGAQTFNVRRLRPWYLLEVVCALLSMEIDRCLVVQAAQTYLKHLG